MKRIIVSQRVDFLKDRGDLRDALDQRPCKFLLTLGLLPFPVPNVLFESSSGLKEERLKLECWLKVVEPNGILFSGGNDLGESKSRDQVENYLMEYAIENRIPLAGICRGMLMMASLDGGTNVRVKGHVAKHHKVSGDINDYVNSFHNFGIIKETPNYNVIALSEDRVIEAMRHKEMPFEGWMWHPERENPFREEDLERFKNLFGV